MKMPRRRMMDYIMSRDGRNPYGSRGGYVVSRDPRDRRMMRRMGMRDRAMMGGEDYNREEMDYDYDRPDMMMRGDSHYEPIEVMGRFNGYYGSNEDYARGMREQDYNYGRDYGYMPYPPYMMDYASQGSEYLSDRDLQMWADKLMKKVEDKDKQFLSRENIRKRADEMGIKFEKYSFEEFYVVVLMKYTDHCKTLGTANMDIYLKLAKDFLEDEDSSLKYGERLAAYYDFVING